jgi:hypothetical protein
VQPEWIAGVVVAAVVIVGLVGLLWPKRKPPSLVFTCARCRKTTRHSNRTAEAWRHGSQKLFCNECHRLWLQSRPPQPRELREHEGYQERRGCLGVVALAAAFPFGLVLAWLYT